MMEKRSLIAIALSVGILLAWQVWMAPAPPSRPVPEAASPTAAPGAGPPVPATGGSEAPAGTWVVRTGSGEGAEAGAEVTTPLYRISFDGDGAARAWALEYRGRKPLVIGGGIRPLAVGLMRAGQPGVELVPLRAETAGLVVTPAAPQGTLRFSGATPDGIRIQKTLEFRVDSYQVDAQLRVRAPAGTSPVGVALYWTSPITLPGAKAGEPWQTFGEVGDHRQLLGRILVDRAAPDPEAFDAPPPALKDVKDTGGRVELKDPRPITPGLAADGARWVALEDDYFIAAVLGTGGGQLWRARDHERTAAALVFPGAVEPGQLWTATTRLYVGPKEWEQLKAVGVGLEGAQARNYGQFLWLLPMWWFAVPLLWLMNFFGTHVPGHNYGVAIILLTVLVKGLFYPLAQKSMTSMKRMQALQPQLNALKSKYRSDTQRFQREQMELFRKHKVNPMGGCLPMVVQIPIFYALYLTLQYSVELQGAPFLLWITDLSKKDVYYVLPILMGVSMLIQQKMTPTVGDPRQARVMLIMPVVFTFMFLEFPTGLVLYWLVNNLLSIGQQYLIDRSLVRRQAGLPEGRVEKEARKA